MSKNNLFFWLNEDGSGMGNAGTGEVPAGGQSL